MCTKSTPVETIHKSFKLDPQEWSLISFSWPAATKTRSITSITRAETQALKKWNKTGTIVADYTILHILHSYAFPLFMGPWAERQGHL